MIHNMLWRANQWLTRLLHRNHKRRKTRWNFEGHDD